MIDADFEAVVRDNSARLYSLCYRLTGEATEAEDLCQEAFSKAFKAWSRFEGRSHVSTWLYRIAVNAWKNRLRGRRLKLFRLFTGDDNETPVDFPSHEPLPGEALEQKEKETVLYKALAHLDPQERLILTLRDLEEKSYEDIATILELPMGTVKSRLYRAREILKIKLTPVLKSMGEIS
jgi:RNA polymerase sigma-70 factor (ECF subfamily)